MWQELAASSRRLGLGWADLLVWSVLLPLTAGACAYVLSYGSRTPFHDDLAVLYLWLPTPQRTLAGLWALHNEHRVPLPRLLRAGWGCWSRPGLRE